MEEIRLIDANALKENLLKNLRCDTCYKVQLINLIDNAPTLNLEKTSFMKGYNYGCDDGKRFYERPHGEWLIDGHHIRCNRCNEYICNTDREGNKIPDNFCPNCGADMKKEETE